MSKKNEKKLCWNCEGEISHHLSQCPYCGVDASQPLVQDERSIFKGYNSPFQTAPQEAQRPPYARGQSPDCAVTEEEWKAAVDEEPKKEGRISFLGKQETIALLLLPPGVVFFLFGLVLLFFSNDGVLTLQWNQNVAYFYFLGAIPLFFLGYRALGRRRTEDP